MNLEILHDEAKGKFSTELKGSEAFLLYRPVGDNELDYRSTVVPDQHRHLGIGEQIVKHALEFARENGYKVIPTCPFVTWVVERNPEYREIIAV